MSLHRRQRTGMSHSSSRSERSSTSIMSHCHIALRHADFRTKENRTYCSEMSWKYSCLTGAVMVVITVDSALDVYCSLSTLFTWLVGWPAAFVFGDRWIVFCFALAVWFTDLIFSACVTGTPLFAARLSLVVRGCLCPSCLRVCSARAQSSRLVHPKT